MSGAGPVYCDAQVFFAGQKKVIAYYLHLAGQMKFVLAWQVKGVMGKLIGQGKCT